MTGLSCHKGCLNPVSELELVLLIDKVWTKSGIRLSCSRCDRRQGLQAQDRSMRAFPKQSSSVTHGIESKSEAAVTWSENEPGKQRNGEQLGNASWADGN
jgi:hypothetical protein